jgi:hypothetical protein
MTIVKFKQTVKRKGAKVVQFCFALKNKQGELTELHCYTQGCNRNRGLGLFLVSNPKYNKSKIVNE